MENINIKDFQSVSAAEKIDNILMVLSDGLGVKITIDLLVKMLVKDVKPSIVNGMWHIGGISTAIEAIGKTPQFRTSEVGIEWKYEDESTWRILIGYDVLKLKFSDLTPDDVQSLKLTLSDLTEEEILSLKGAQGEKGDIGMSAYQFAVNKGYKGTEEQFAQEQTNSANNSARLKNVEDNKQDKPIAGRTFLTPLFVARGAVFNDKTGYYELNGLTDITETQMMNIYSHTSNFALISYSLRMNKTIRTNYVPNGYWSYYTSNAFAGTSLEVVNLTGCQYCLDASNMFMSSYKLKKIIGYITVNYNKTPSVVGMFKDAISLESVILIGVQSNISFSDSPLLNRESILYMINESANTSVITVTLHGTAKARLTEEDIALAVSKNITIA